MKHIKIYEDFLNEEFLGESKMIVTPSTFSKDEKNLNKIISKVYRGTGLAAKAVDAISAQMKHGNDSRIKSVTLTSDDSDSEIYVELKNGTIYDRGNLEFDDVLADIKLIDNANVIAKMLAKSWNANAVTKDGREMSFVWLSKSNYDSFGKDQGHNLFDVLMKAKGEARQDYSSIGNAKGEREMAGLVRATRLFN
jgi:hypothetical protein